MDRPSEEIPAYSVTGPRLRTDQAVWLVSGDNPKTVSARQIALRANWKHRQPHLAWNPVTGELYKMLPYGSKNRMFPPGSKGADMLAVLVVARTSKPFTDYPGEHRQALLRILQGQGIPAVWPAGPPTDWSSPGGAPGCGHYAATQLYGGGFMPLGKIDIKRLSYEGKPVNDPQPEDIPTPPDEVPVPQEADWDPQKDDDWGEL